MATAKKSTKPVAVAPLPDPDPEPERDYSDIPKGWPRVMHALADRLPWDQVGPTLNEWKWSSHGPSDALASVLAGKLMPGAD